MKIKDKKIFDIIDELSSKYNIFTHNQFMNYYLLDSAIQKNDWIDIEDMLNSNNTYEEEGYELDKLYTQILAFTSFLTVIKEEILPRIQNEAQRRMDKMTSDSKILYKMTLDNTPLNLRTFTSLITDLFINVKRVDKTKNGEENAMFKQLDFIKEIQDKLNG
jgi:hypothetical protein